ncbi:MAG TPA: DUF1015 domain-containing protein [Candidatus Avacidaminococcus intestinavium]|uniref:DUF1015 domain-containing protein n=1 Tax=Candidatus Avacidaminococcus intestinavium TaxID=2840684 RepID=A0A9D1MQZ1_9FIRM|nr:DUF1015 domain-containing protein [Candidatus Avacidaminococcus intestinavium]
MAIVKPFRGLRPIPKLAHEIASLPYDVVSTKEARYIIEKQPLSFLRVTKAEATLPENTDVHSKSVYERARNNLNQYIADGVLQKEKKDCFYIYAQEMQGRLQIGLVACVSVNEYKNNIIKKHELTRPDKELDRFNHITTTKAQTGFVFLTYKDTNDISAYLQDIMKNKVAEYSFITEDKIKHELYLVDDDAKIKYLQKAFLDVSHLYIADGHHRSAAALRVAEKQAVGRAGNNNYQAECFLAAIFPDSMLKVMDYNRLIKDLNGLTKQEFFLALQDYFILNEVGDELRKPQTVHEFMMYLENKWYSLRAKSSSYNAENIISSLDVEILQNNLLGPILGIENPRTDERIDFVGGIRGLKELMHRVDSGEFKVAFALYPTSIEQLLAVADADLIMPPKSTWFEPKLRDGMVIHMIGDE